MFTWEILTVKAIYRCPKDYDRIVTFNNLLLTISIKLKQATVYKIAICFYTVTIKKKNLPIDGKLLNFHSSVCLTIKEKKKVLKTFWAFTKGSESMIDVLAEKWAI